MEQTFGDEEHLVRLWVFGGDAQRAEMFREEYDIRGPVLVDDDNSLRQAYFIPNGAGAFAANPRHYVIDKEGVLVWVGTTVDPEQERQVLEDALR